MDYGAGDLMSDAQSAPTDGTTYNPALATAGVATGRTSGAATGGSSRKTSVEAKILARIQQEENARLAAKAKADAEAAAAAAAASQSAASSGAANAGPVYAPDDADPEVSFLYQPGAVASRLAKYMNKLVEFRVSSKFITLRNRSVVARHIWGGHVDKELRAALPFVSPTIAARADALATKAAAVTAATECPSAQLAVNRAVAALSAAFDAEKKSDKSGSDQGQSGQDQQHGDGQSQQSSSSSSSGSLSSTETKALPNGLLCDPATIPPPQLGPLDSLTLAASAPVLSEESLLASAALHSTSATTIPCYCLSPFIYSEDSDIVAMLQHTGLVALRSPAPTNYVALSVICRILPPLPEYPATDNAGLRTRACPGTNSSSCAAKASIQIVRIETVEQGSPFQLYRRRVSTGPDIRLLKTTIRQDALVEGVSNASTANSSTAGGGSLGPGSGPAASSSSASAAKLRRKPLPEGGILFTPRNEPAIAYSPSVIQDSGVHPARWFSARVAEHSMYFGDAEGRSYELSLTPSGQYRWARVLESSQLATWNLPVVLTAKGAVTLAQQQQRALKAAQDAASSSAASAAPAPTGTKGRRSQSKQSPASPSTPSGNESTSNSTSGARSEPFVGFSSRRTRLMSKYYNAVLIASSQPQQSGSTAPEGSDSAASSDAATMADGAATSTGSTAGSNNLATTLGAVLSATEVPVPLPQSLCEVLYETSDWQDFTWGVSGVQVGGVWYNGLQWMQIRPNYKPADVSRVFKSNQPRPYTPTLGPADFSEVVMLLSTTQQ